MRLLFGCDSQLSNGKKFGNPFLWEKSKRDKSSRLSREHRLSPAGRNCTFKGKEKKNTDRHTREVFL